MIAINQEELKERNLVNTDFRCSDLSGIDLSNTDLNGANFNGAVLVGANFSGANLNGADLTGADLRLSNLNGAFLKGASLEGADIREANIRYAFFNRANLSYADMRRSDIGHTDLSGANLQWTNFDYADMRYANLNYTNPYGANILGAVLTGANLSPYWIDLETVILPNFREIPRLLVALEKGKIDGSTYSGRCACLSGTLAHGEFDETKINESVLEQRDRNRPIELFFNRIEKGDNLRNNSDVRLVYEQIMLICERRNINTKLTIG